LLQSTAIGKMIFRDGISLDDLRHCHDSTLNAVIASATGHKLAIDAESVKVFHSRLSRAIRDEIKVERFDNGDSCSRVLLGAFRAGRIPTDSVLEQAQATLVERAVHVMTKK